MPPVFKTVLLVNVLFLSGCQTPPEKPVAPATDTIEIAKEPDRQVVNYALNLIGTRYRYGGKTPTTGLDCSGLVSHVYKKVGMPIKGSAADMARKGKRIPKSALRAGDLVFFNTRKRPLSHVGIYIGDGRFVHAPGSGERIRISNIHNPYFARRFDTARTYLASAESSTSPHASDQDHEDIVADFWGN